MGASSLGEIWLAGLGAQGTREVPGAVRGTREPESMLKGEYSGLWGLYTHSNRHRMGHILVCSVLGVMG